jgi:hypothetical protein
MFVLLTTLVTPFPRKSFFFGDSGPGPIPLQVIWRQQQRDGRLLLWSRYTWRRGSAPLWWGVSIKNNGIGEAEIKIRPHNTFKGSKRCARAMHDARRGCLMVQRCSYMDGGPFGVWLSLDALRHSSLAPNVCCTRASLNWNTSPILSAPWVGAGARYVRRLQERYTPNPQLDPDPPVAGADGELSRHVAVTFVSLLRKGLPDRDRSEAKLASAFDFVSACAGMVF